VAVGQEAGLYLSSGNYNSFFGRSSGRGSANLNTGSSNSFFGYDSGINISSGNYNSFFGTGSGSGLTTGSYNVFLGNVLIPNTPATATSPGYDTNKTIILADGLQNTKLYIHSNGFTGIGLGNNVIPTSTLEIKAIGGSPSASGLRFTDLNNASPSITNPTNKVLSVNATGDVVLVDGATGSGGTTTITAGSNIVVTGNTSGYTISSPTANTLANNVNTMTSTVNGVVASAPIVNSVVNTVAAGQLTTTVNGVTSTPVALPALTEVDGDVTNELQTLGLAGNVLSISNGNSVTLPTYTDTDQQTLSITGNQLTISNGNTVTLPVASTPECNIYTCNGTIDTSGDLAQGIRMVTLGNNNLVFNNSTTTDNTRGKIYIGSSAIFGVNQTSTLNNYNLFVEKGILTEKIKVALRTSANWRDSVFANDYKLMPLKEVESYIQNNKHLPGISSAEELVKEGLDLGEMQAKQMEKIEELTLYAIEQNKKIEKQEKEIEELKVLVKALVNKNK